MAGVRLRRRRTFAAPPRSFRLALACGRSGGTRPPARMALRRAAAPLLHPLVLPDHARHRRRLRLARRRRHTRARQPAAALPPDYARRLPDDADAGVFNRRRRPQQPETALSRHQPPVAGADSCRRTQPKSRRICRPGLRAGRFQAACAAAGRRLLALPACLLAHLPLPPAAGRPARRQTAARYVNAARGFQAALAVVGKSSLKVE